MAIDLWQIRRQKRMTIDELARSAEIHPGLIKAYELGERPISDGDLVRLAAALEVAPSDIKQMSDPPPRGPSRQRQPPSYDSGAGQQQRYDNFGGYDRSAGYSPRYSNYSSRSGGYDSDQPRQGGYSNDPQRQSGYAPRRSSSSSGYQQRTPSRGRSSRPPKKSGGRKPRPLPAPARQSQIEHLKMLLVRLEMSGDELLRLAGKPLSMLNRKEAAQLLTTCQTMLSERKPEKPKGKRQRPYLPESVDEHELLYLTKVQLENRPLSLTLFNGETMHGTLVGFSPYALTVADGDGQETTVQKLAIAYYQAPASLVPPTNGVETNEESEPE
ncbi:MAG: helix-turn-helix domain-containing protein [Caldilineae bacterium]|nr:helix-turn-helix domain-containing protein [Anaerolineae bacterium]MCB0204451.1 helix-turn-helix domain-containing protein [Anaerolineae bacterium]MCB0252728.1 helix-turn-helix domain-containing protein [Anaerolineae bacterium]MCB9154589.1 helix-turn-helix domain-containing protein [Caldilineae bacterium]